MNTETKAFLKKQGFIFDRVHVAVVVEARKEWDTADLGEAGRYFELRQGELARRIALNRLLVIKRCPIGCTDEILRCSKQYLRYRRHEAVYIGIGKEIRKREELGLGLISAELALETIYKNAKEFRVRCYENMGIERLISSLSSDSNAEFRNEL